MTVIPAHALASSDLRRLGHNLPVHVRRDHRHMHEAINRSLAVHGEQLPDDLEPAIEPIVDQATASEFVAS